MAETKAKKSTTKKVEATDELVDEVEFLDADLDKRVSVRNLADWQSSMTLQNENGSVEIPPHSVARISRNELMTQKNINNTSLVGIDGYGSHATLYVEDTATRCWLGFETKDKPQVFFNDDVVRKLFAMSFEKFKENLPKEIVTRAEKFALKDSIVRLRLNDYNKLRVCAKYIGTPLESLTPED